MTTRLFINGNKMKKQPKNQAKEPAIDNKELILALEELEKEKGMNKEYLLEAIEISKKNSLERLLFGLGIEGIGDKTALLLARTFKTLDNLASKTYDELLSIKDIGPTLANNIVNFFANQEKKELIGHLKEM